MCPPSNEALTASEGTSWTVCKQMRQGSHDHPLDAGADTDREQRRRLTDGAPDSGGHLVGGAGAGQLVI